MSKYEDVYNNTTYNGSLRFALFCCGVSTQYSAQHFTALARSVTKLLLQSPYLFGHVIAAANVDHC